MVAVLAQYASRFSVRALDLTVDASLLWVGVALALAAAVLLAFVPRLPSTDAAKGLGLSSGSVRITSGTNRRLRAFAVTQIAASFVLLAGAGMLLTTLLALQAAQTGFKTRNVLALNVPVVSYTRRPSRWRPSTRKRCVGSRSYPGVERVAVGTTVPWRDAGNFGPGFQFSVEGYAKANGEEDPRARFRTVSPGFFAALGVPIIAGRDFTDADRRDARAGRHHQPERGAPDVPRRRTRVNRRLMWTDPVMKFIGVSTDPRRIVGVAADVDDENVVPGPGDERLSPLRAGDRRRPHVRSREGGSLCARPGDHEDHPSSCRPISRLKRAATLDDIRAEVLAPNRLNALVFGGFAASR